MQGEAEREAKAFDLSGSPYGNRTRVAPGRARSEEVAYPQAATELEAVAKKIAALSAG